MMSCMHLCLGTRLDTTLLLAPVLLPRAYQVCLVRSGLHLLARLQHSLQQHCVLNGLLAAEVTERALALQLPPCTRFGSVEGAEAPLVPVSAARVSPDVGRASAAT